MKKIRIDNLVLEVTRACNMNCVHCLRGEELENDIMFMPAYDIKKLLFYVESIGNLTFSGGEPSLAIAQMKYTLKVLKRYAIPLQSFYVVTNGKQITNEFMSTIDDFYEYCLSWSYRSDVKMSLHKEYQYVNYALDDFLGGVALSVDEFHEPIPMKNIVKLMSRCYFRNDKFTNEMSGIVARGRAKNLDLPKKRIIDYPVEELSVKPHGDGEVMIEQLYMNTHGDLMADCNLSYDMQSKYSFGNIHNPKCFDSILEDQGGRTGTQSISAGHDGLPSKIRME